VTDAAARDETAAWTEQIAQVEKDIDGSVWALDLTGSYTAARDETVHVCRSRNSRTVRMGMPAY